MLILSQIVQKVYDNDGFWHQNIVLQLSNLQCIIPIKYCNKRDTRVIPIQQQNPSKSAFFPLCKRCKKFVLRPIAAIAIVMKNFDRFFAGRKTWLENPKLVQTVVKRLARMKKKIKVGKRLFTENFRSTPTSLLV